MESKYKKSLGLKVKVLILSNIENVASVIMEGITGLLYTQFYSGHLEDFDTKEAKTNKIFEEAENFYNYFEVSK